MRKQITKTGIVLLIFILTVFGLSQLEQHTERLKNDTLQTTWVNAGIELHRIDIEKRSYDE